MKRGLLLSLLLAFVATCCFSLAQAQEVYASASQTMRGEKTKAVYKPLKKVMQDLRDKRGIYFMFNSKDIQQVVVNAAIKEGATIEEILEGILTPVGLTYKKVDNIYVIVEKSNPDVTPKVQNAIDQTTGAAQENSSNTEVVVEGHAAPVKGENSSV